MSIDRIATAQQSAYFLAQINQAGSALDKTQQQIASGVVSSTYAGFGSQAQVLQATISANARNKAYANATGLATTQTDMQDTQLTSLSSLLDTVGAHDTQLGQLIGSFDSLMTGLANDRGQIGSAIDNLASAESLTSNLITEAQPTLNEDIGALTQSVHVLFAHQQGLDAVLQGLPGLVGALAKIQSSGNWINVYLCNLTLNVSGQLDISLIPGESPSGEYPNPVTLPSGAVGNQGLHTASCS